MGATETQARQAGGSFAAVGPSGRPSRAASRALWWLAQDRYGGVNLSARGGAVRVLHGCHGRPAGRHCPSELITIEIPAPQPTLLGSV
jgi:hypothetical protein